jgi:hypothetical protein
VGGRARTLLSEEEDGSSDLLSLTLITLPLFRDAELFAGSIVASAPDEDESSAIGPGGLSFCHGGEASEHASGRLRHLLRNARSHGDPRGNDCPSAPAMHTPEPPDCPVGSTVSHVHAGSKQKSSSVGSVDQTAGAGAEHSRGPSPLATVRAGSVLAETRARRNGSRLVYVHKAGSRDCVPGIGEQEDEVLGSPRPALISPLASRRAKG